MHRGRCRRRASPPGRRHRLLLLAAGLLLGSAAAASGQGYVVVDDDTLLQLHGALGPFSARARADAANARLRALGALGRDSVVAIERGAFTELVVGGTVLLTVTDADIVVPGQRRPEVARVYARRLDVALRQSRERRSARALAIDAALAAAATGALAALLALFAWLFPRLSRRVDRLRSAYPHGIVSGVPFVSADRIAAVLTTVLWWLRVVATVLVFYVYVPLVLSLFPWTAPLSRQIVDVAMTPFVSAARAALAYLPNLFYLLAIVIITRYLLKATHAVFRAVGSGALSLGDFQPEWAEPTYKLVRVLILAFAVVILFPYLPGSGSEAFKGVSLFAGILLSIGSSGAINNVVAGVVLTYTGAFRVGERVKIGDTVGDITHRTLLVTRIRSTKNEEISIPNGNVLGSHVVNYSRLAAENGLVLHTTVTIGYDVPWRTVTELLLQAARATPDILETPAPFVLQTSLDDFYVSYQLNGYSRHPELMPATYSALHAHIQDAFNGAGVEIMSPHYRSLRDGNQTTVPAENLPADYVAPAFQVQRRTGA